jgi:hypothetical protein
MVMNKVKLNQKVSVDFQTPKDESFKFGYYNYNPISADGTKLLAHKINFEGRLPQENDAVEVGFFDLKTSKWIPLQTSKAFNWQQCSMLQWLGPDFNDRIIFNDYEEGKFISRIINVHTKESKTICKAIYAVHPSGEYSISLNFERCSFTRAYSYAPKVDEYWKDISPEEDVIIKVDLLNNTFKKIISLDRVIKNSKLPIESSKHWFEHIMLNKSGSRFAFYHRYETERGFVTRCLTANSDGSEIWNLPLSDTELISHLGWSNDEDFVVYTRPQSKFKSLWVGKPNKKIKDNLVRKVYRLLIKPIIPEFVKKKVIPIATSYYLNVKDKKGRMGKIEISPKGMDGHPSFLNSGNYMLTDTYADLNNERHLLLHDLVNNKTIKIGSFFSHYNNCNWRADLHPRFNSEENKIIIDLNLDGNTQIMVINLELFNLN